MSEQPEPGGLEDVREASEPVEVGNEFAFVRVRKVLTRNGERIEIQAPRIGRVIRLDSLELESLTWQTHETLSKFMERPFGMD